MAFLRPAVTKLDHIVLASRNVEKTCEAFYKLTGCKPTFGGSHVNRGTKNYLVNIGEDKYLEFIGLDYAQNVEEIVRKGGSKAIPFGVYDLREAESKIVTFACVTSRLKETASAASWVGLPFSMSRKTPEGNTLNWSLAVHESGATTKYSSIYPFLIDWETVHKQNLHPAKTSPTGCRLVSLLVEAQDPDKYIADLNHAGIGKGIFCCGVVSVCKAESCDKDRLLVVLDTPKGIVTLSDNMLNNLATVGNM
eukprot:g8464.t1